MKKLVNISIDEVSLVDKPANDRKFLIIKNADKGGEENMTIEEILEKIEEEDLKNSLQKILDEKEEALSKLENQVEELEEEDDDEIEKEEEEDLEIDLPEDVQKSIESLEKRVELAEKHAKEELTKRKEIEFTKKAENFTKVADVEKISYILLKADEVGDDFYSSIEKVLKSAQTRIEKGNLDTPEGTLDEGDTTDAQTQMNKLTDEVIEKNNSLTREQAMVKVLEENPNLYNDYLSEDQ